MSAPRVIPPVASSGGASFPRVMGTIVSDGLGGHTIEPGAVNIASATFIPDNVAGSLLQVVFTTPLATATYPIFCQFFSQSQYLAGTGDPWASGGGDGRLDTSVTLQFLYGNFWDPSTTIMSIMILIP